MENRFVLEGLGFCGLQAANKDILFISYYQIIAFQKS